MVPKIIHQLLYITRFCKKYKSLHKQIIKTKGVIRRLIFKHLKPIGTQSKVRNRLLAKTEEPQKICFIESILVRFGLAFFKIY